MPNCMTEIGFIRTLPAGAMGDNRTSMEQMIKRATDRAIQAERARLRAVLLSVVQQCGGPVQFAVKRIAEGLE